MATITQTTRREKNRAWPKGGYFYVATFVNGRVRNECWTACKRSEEREIAKRCADAVRAQLIDEIGG